MNTANYERELDFFKKCLNHLKISYHVYSLDREIVFEDLGIRHALGYSSQNYQGLISLFKDNLSPNKICYITDEFSCQYIAFILPKKSQNIAFIIGPYITPTDKDGLLRDVYQSDLPSLWISILQDYYTNICTTTDIDVLNTLLYTLADFIWGNNNFTSHYYSFGLLDSIHPFDMTLSAQSLLDFSNNIDLIEKLYSAENELANAISCGQATRARTIFLNFPSKGIRFEAEPLRNLKNFSITVNTIFRKATEQGGVHPLYIDQVSTAFMERIENMERTDNIFNLWNDMIQKYCTLVNTYNTRNYSLPIQKAITRINFDVSADLSLKATAEYLNVNASYLSTLFKKETGYTLTNYVNKKRMEQAAFLLSTTVQSISAIAQQCGILDENYFTKLFKRHYQMTPSQYRDTIGHGAQ